MKLYKLFALSMVTFALASCDKSLEQGLEGANVSVEVNDNVVSDGRLLPSPKVHQSSSILMVILITLLSSVGKADISMRIVSVR